MLCLGRHCQHTKPAKAHQWRPEGACPQGPPPPAPLPAGGGVEAPGHRPPPPRPRAPGGGEDWITDGGGLPGQGPLFPCIQGKPPPHLPVGGFFGIQVAWFAPASRWRWRAGPAATGGVGRPGPGGSGCSPGTLPGAQRAGGSLLSSICNSRSNVSSSAIQFVFSCLPHRSLPLRWQRPGQPCPHQPRFPLRGQPGCTATPPHLRGPAASLTRLMAACHHPETAGQPRAGVPNALLPAKQGRVGRASELPPATATGRWGRAGDCGGGRPGLRAGRRSSCGSASWACC